MTLGSVTRAFEGMRREAVHGRLDPERESFKRGEAWLKAEGYREPLHQAPQLPKRERRVILNSEGHALEELEHGYSVWDRRRDWNELCLGVGWQLLLGELYGADSTTRSAQAHDLVRREAPEVYQEKVYRDSEGESEVQPEEGKPADARSEPAGGIDRAPLEERQDTRLTRDEKSQLVATAKRLGISPSKVIRKLIREGTWHD